MFAKLQSRKKIFPFFFMERPYCTLKSTRIKFLNILKLEKCNLLSDGVKEGHFLSESKFMVTCSVRENI